MPSQSIGFSEGPDPLRSAVRMLNRLAQGGDGRLMQRFAWIRPPKESVRRSEAGIQLKRLLRLFNSLIVSARTPENKPQAPMDNAGAWIQANGAFEFGVSLLVTSHHGKIEPEPIMRCRVARVEFNGLLKFSLGGHEIVVIPRGDPS